MFERFENYVGLCYSKEMSTVHDFLERYSGQSFKNGLYRIHNYENVSKWNDIVGDTFPTAKGLINVFGYDWLGRNFAIDNGTDTVIIFEPGTGEAFDTGLNFYDFHNIEILKNDNFCLQPKYFEEWYEANNKYKLKNNECAGYKVPLFLNGKDDISNLEVSDMEVYWVIMSQLI